MYVNKFINTYVYICMCLYDIYIFEQGFQIITSASH